MSALAHVLGIVLSASVQFTPAPHGLEAHYAYLTYAGETLMLCCARPQHAEVCIADGTTVPAGFLACVADLSNFRYPTR